MHDLLAYQAGASREAGTLLHTASSTQMLPCWIFAQVDDLLAYQEGRGREAELGQQLESIGGAQDNVSACGLGERGMFGVIAATCPGQTVICAALTAKCGMNASLH